MIRPLGIPLFYYLFAAEALLLGAWLLFKDSMNLFQKVGRLYWITRNNMRRKQPLVGTAFLAHDSPPYYVGRGIQFAWKRRSFQIGWITGTNPDFNPNLFYADSRLRDWTSVAKERVRGPAQLIKEVEDVESEDD